MATAPTPVNRFGLIDTKVQTLIDDGKRRARLNLIRTQQNTSPTEKAAGIGGFGLGNAMADMFERFAGGSKDDVAAQVSSAQKRARSVLASTPEELRDRGSFSGPIQERQILIQELDAADLSDQSNIVRQQIVDLATQQQEFRKAEGDNTKMDLDIQEQRERIRRDAIDKNAKDALTRFLNEQETLDLTDPAQAKRFDVLGKQIEKLNAPTKGSTEFDVPFDKVTIRKVDETLQATVGALDGFLQADLEFNPELLTAFSAMKSWAFGATEVLGMGLDPEQTKQLQEFARFRQITSTSLNAYIKQVTGAQMSEAEATRLTQDVPNKGDSPSVYKAKLERIIEDLSSRRDRALHALEASDDPDEFRKRNSLPLIQFREQAALKNAGRIEQLTGQALIDATSAAAARIRAQQQPAPQG